jgi:hypothetical protein
MTLHLGQFDKYKDQLTTWRKYKAAFLRRLEAVNNKLWVRCNYEGNMAFAISATKVRPLPGAYIPRQQEGMVGAEYKSRYYTITPAQIEDPEFPPLLGTKLNQYMEIEEYNAELAEGEKPKKHKLHRRDDGVKVIPIECGSKQFYLETQELPDQPLPGLTKQRQEPSPKKEAPVAAAVG